MTKSSLDGCDRPNPLGFSEESFDDVAHAISVSLSPLYNELAEFGGYSGSGADLIDSVELDRVLTVAIRRLSGD